MFDEGTPAPPLAAVALGACVIEKHLTLDKNLPGPDHLSSLEPHEFKSMVEAIRSVESSLGHGRKEPAPREASTAAAARKSLVAVADIPVGTILTEELVIAKRPGTGLSPALIDEILERKVRCSVPEGSLITMENADKLSAEELKRQKSVKSRGSEIG